MDELMISPNDFKLPCPKNSRRIKAHNCRGFNGAERARCPFYGGTRIGDSPRSKSKPRIYIKCGFAELTSTDGDFLWDQTCGDCGDFNEGALVCLLIKQTRRSDQVACPFWRRGNNDGKETTEHKATVYDAPGGSPA